MGFYDRVVLPRILNAAMGMKDIGEERQKALAEVQGAVLEIGFGSGHNLPYYPAAVSKVVGVDPSGQSAKLAEARIRGVRFPVEFVELPGEEIAAPDASFDSAVSTYSLCTIPDPIAALRQLNRVLKPDGRLYFLEHGRSEDEGVRRWQDRLNGFQGFICGGCNLNREIDRLIDAAGFEIERIERYYGRSGPRPMVCLYRGVAKKRSPE
ncbi:MAG: class I SAM-dependent methyltransferase [Myxococcota bacterium]